MPSSRLITICLARIKVVGRLKQTAWMTVNNAQIDRESLFASATQSHSHPSPSLHEPHQDALLLGIVYHIMERCCQIGVSEKMYWDAFGHFG